MKENRSLQELKNKCKLILQEESKQHGIDININPITIVEYYNSDIFKQQTKLKQIKEKYTIIKPCGFFDPKTEKIIVFIDRLTKHQKADSIYILPTILFAVYHEYKHQLQFASKEISELEEFIIKLEKHIAANKTRDYNKNHEQYFIEISANLYAYNKTLEYIKNNEPNIYEQIKLYLETRWILNTKQCQINYDPRKTFDKFYKYYKFKKIVMIYLDVAELDIFLDENNNFKTLKSIINSCRTKNIDKTIVLSILGSESYLNQLDISKLNNEEKQFMLNIIDNVLEEEFNRIQQNIKCYEERKVNRKIYLSSLSSILKKIRYLNAELKECRCFRNKKKNNLSNKYLKKIRRKLSSYNIN